MNSILMKTSIVLSAAFLLAAAAPARVDAQGALVNGAMLSGSIGSIGDSDTWTFSANSGDAIIVRVGELTQANDFTPRLRLYNPSAGLVAFSYGVSAAEVAATASASGTFSVIVDDYSSGLDGTGTYRITLAQSGTAVTVSGGDQGGPLTNGVMHTGTIDLGDNDVWTLDAVAGDAIVARMGELSAGSTLTPQLRLYGPTGNLVSGSYGVSATEVLGTAAVTGTYIVVAGDYSSGLAGTGDYRLTLAKTGTAVTVSGGDQGGPLTNGVMHTGTIDLGDHDVWTLDAVAGDAIVARMGELSAGSTLTPQLRLYGPTGNLVSGSYGVSATEVLGTASVTGTYIVVAGDYSSGLAGTGDYRVTLAKTGTAVTVSGGDQGGPLTNGAMHTGTIDLGDLDVWTVAATAGDAIVARMGELSTSSTLTPQLRLYGPTGNLMSVSYGVSATEVAGTASVTGTYIVVAGDYSSGLAGTEDYRLTLATTGAPVTTSPGDEGGPLPSGLSLAMLDLGDLDLWTVHANAGENVIVTMEEIVAGSTLTPDLRLYSPTGALLRSNYGVSHAQVSATAPVTGTYLVIAGDFSSGLAGTGTYRLTPAATIDAQSAALPAALALAAPAPNPFVARTRLRYALPRVSAVALRVFDAQGRLVRTLVDDAAKPAGEYDVSWDGADAAGRRAGAGIYFARLDAEGRSEMQKVLLAK